MGKELSTYLTRVHFTFIILFPRQFTNKLVSFRTIKGGIQTNNAVEGWNRHINAKLRACCKNVFDYIEALKNEVSYQNDRWILTISPKKIPSPANVFRILALF